MSSSIDGAAALWQPKFPCDLWRIVPIFSLAPNQNWRVAVAMKGEASLMTKSELIAALGQANPHLTDTDVEKIITTIFDQIGQALARGERVELRGFGAFTIKQRMARTGRNPRTGQAVPVYEKVVPFFKAGKELRNRVNKGATRTEAIQN